MKYTLAPLPCLVREPAPDLREILQERRRRQRDLRLPSAQVRFVADPSFGLRVGGRTLPLTGGAREFLGERIGLGRARVNGSSVDRLNDWLAAREDVLIRFEGETVRALLPGDVRTLDTLELLDETVSRLKRLDVEARLEHCVEEDGELFLTAVAPQLAAEVNVGDYVYGGFFLSHSETTFADTEASVRIYRVACRNGALMDCSEGQRLVLPRRLEAGAADPYAGWPEKLGQVIARSFDGGDLDLEARRFESTLSQVIATPFEILTHLVAAGLIREEDQLLIQQEFAAGRDDSIFALVNAVTFQAHGLRDGGDWARAFAMERLGGEFLRGDHQPPVLEPVPV